MVWMKDNYWWLKIILENEKYGDKQKFIFQILNEKEVEEIKANTCWLQPTETKDRHSKVLTLEKKSFEIIWKTLPF